MSEIKNQAKSLRKHDQVLNYIATAQIFLKDNFFLEEKLKPEHIKDRLLGHWGTVPGISFVYSNLNRLINKHEDRDFLYVVGPGHGFPGFQAGLFLDQSLTKFYPEKIPYNKKGLEEIIQNFSTPYGYPSHLNPDAPGTIVEGGELGYSLSIAAGSVMDNPDVITTCLIGDGEAETGPIAASWHYNKILNPKTDGAVLPILHLNGYKISGPTFFGRMKDSELKKYFEGLGYRVFFIDSERKKDFYVRGIEIFDKAMRQIKTVQDKARSGQDVIKPKWPVIILKTPKGMGATQSFGDKKIVGNHHSHQVVFDHLKEDSNELQALETWMQSYDFEKLLSFNGEEIILDEHIKTLLPKDGRSIGTCKNAYGGDIVKDLDLPEIKDFLINQEAQKEEGKNPMYEAGKFLKSVFEKNDGNIRLFCPDETDSNKLTHLLDYTGRAWQMPIKAFDDRLSKDGKVVEMLSEHVLFGMLWGYTITGRHGFFVTYEAFGQIVSSMADQYVKFIKMSKRIGFRKPVPSMNVVLSSLLERQDHNGFSHQNPSFIASSMDRDREITNVYLPADKNFALLAFEKTIKSKDELNVIVASKKMTRTWLSTEDTIKKAEEEISIWEDYSDENPDVVLVTAGDYVTEEAVIGLRLAREVLPEVKIRFANVFKLDVLNEENQKISNKDIVKNIFTEDKGIVFNFHGYSETIKKLLFDYHLSERIIINGYDEEGSTTSPFDMKARNGLSRFHLVENIARIANSQGVLPDEKYSEIAEKMKQELEKEQEYIIEHKVDPDYIKHW